MLDTKSKLIFKVTREHQGSEDLGSHDFRKKVSNNSLIFFQFLSQGVEGQQKAEDWGLNKSYLIRKTEPVYHGSMTCIIYTIEKLEENI